MATSLLLADDSPTIAKILSLALAKDNYAVRSVTTADQALEEIHKHPPDLFLVDIALPIKNGKEFIKYIRGAPKLANIKIILITNAFEPVNEADLLRDGADGVLTKPFDPATLRQKLQELLKNTPPLPPQSEATDDTDGISLPPPMGGSGHTPPPFTIEFSTNTMITGIPSERERILPPPVNEPTVALDLANLQTELQTAEPPAPPPHGPDFPAPNHDALNEFFNAEVPPADVSRETPSGVFELPVSGPEAPAGASAGEVQGLFDIGGSTFSFSPDYVNRLTKAFEGNAPSESLPKNFKQANPTEQAEPAAFFPTESSDTPPAQAQTWNNMDVEKMEAVIREEVRTAIQEIVPKLAERLIREELDRVMRETEN